MFLETMNVGDIYYLHYENQMVFMNNLTLKLMLGVNVYDASINLSQYNHQITPQNVQIR